jgi:hypothetical protein
VPSFACISEVQPCVGRVGPSGVYDGVLCWILCCPAICTRGRLCHCLDEGVSIVHLNAYFSHATVPQQRRGMVLQVAVLKIQWQTDGDIDVQLKVRWAR